MSVDWSPDGRFILTTAATPDYQTKRLFLVDAIAGGEPKLLYGQSPAQVARWSPDGARIIFDTDPSGGLWTVRADGSEPGPVPGYHSLGRYHSLASFTPEGARVCSTGVFAQDHREIFLWDFQEGGNWLMLTQNGANNQSPAMRPDGWTVLFSSDAGIRVGGGLRHVRAAAVDEPGRDARVFRCFYDYEWGPVVAWSPDGRQFAVQRPYPGRLWLVTVDGLDDRPLKLDATPREGGLLVTLTNRYAQKVNVTYRVFDSRSVQVAEGPVGKPDLALQTEEVIECPLSLEAATKPGTYTVKITAVTDRGQTVELVDYEVK
jgi:Tol biopolymer transport system component